MVKNGFLVLFLAGIISACSGGGSGGGASTDTGTPGAGGSIGHIGSNGSIKWTKCTEDSGFSYSGTFSASGSTLTYLNQNFSQPSCDPTGLFRQNRYTYKGSTSGTNATETTATNINLVLEKVEWIAMDAGSANDFNAGQYCGKTDWVHGQWIDVTNTSCGTAGDGLYSIFKVSGNQLFMGQPDGGANDGSTEQTRHIVLDSDPYVKP